MDTVTTPKKKDSSELSGQVTMSPASLNEMESKMRDEIRKLQERRVAVLMDEVMQLQNEKDNLLSKITSLENENQKFKEENVTLKATGKPSVQITVLERALQQEKDDKNKLKQQLRVIKRRNSGLISETNLNKGKSNSMNDIQDSTDGASIKGTTDLTRLKKLETKALVVNTPSPRPKRYVLAATSTRDMSTQTPTSSEDDMVMSRDTAAENDKDNKTIMLNEDLKAALSEAKSTILEVLQEKEV